MSVSTAHASTFLNDEPVKEDQSHIITTTICPTRSVLTVPDGPGRDRDRRALGEHHLFAREGAHASDEHVVVQSLLVVGQQLVGPLDGRAQRAVPVVAAGTATAEQVERAVEAIVQVSQREGGQPACGQLDGQRHAVEPPHDVGHPVPVVRLGPDARARSRKTCTDGAGSSSARGRGSGASRNRYSAARPRGSRLVANTVSAGHAVRAASTVSRAAFSRCSQLSTTRRPGRVASTARQAGEDIAACDGEVQRGRERVRDGRGVGDRGEQQHRRRVTGVCHLQRHPGLADPAGSDKGHQPLGRQQPVQRGHLSLAPDQPCQRAGRSPRLVEGRGRRRYGGTATRDVAFHVVQRG